MAVKLSKKMKKLQRKNERTRKVKVVSKDKKQNNKNVSKKQSRKTKSNKRNISKLQSGGGNILTDTDIIVTNMTSKLSNIKNLVEGSELNVSTKPWVQPELSKF